MKIEPFFAELEGSLPCAITIGTFDGVHLGHQALFSKLKETGHPTAVVTFSTHPLQTLSPHKSLLLITPLPIKLALLEAAGFESAVVLPFSRAIADLPFDQFLEKLPLSHLVLGKEASFGKGRDGNETNVRAWGENRGVPVEYIEKTKVGKESISSRRIRDAIKMGDLTLVEQLLGRPHLVMIPANTTRFSVTGLAMPPDGHYALSQGVQAQLTTSGSERFMQIKDPLPQETIVSFNPTIHIPLRGIHVI